MIKEAAQKFGSLYQYGVEFMEEFNQDANLFLSAYNLYKNEISENGYSKEWDLWKESNQDLIIRLYDALNTAGKIPSTPLSE
jgi:hypothetical protein